jgi:GNAT superfamily N-acetyltransferase
VKEYINRPDIEHCFETPAIHALDTQLQPFGLKTCFQAEYFLPDVERMEILPCKYHVKVLHRADFASLYLPEWSNALCEKRKEADVLAIGAYDGDRLVGLAGCSADCEDMYQIGVDVLPEYRRQGIASALTSRLASEVLAMGKVPFYCAAWSNIKSVRNAIRCGFRPAWVELTARKKEYVDGMNEG